MRKKNNDSKMTFTKIMVSVILFVSLLDVQFVFVLAFLGREQIAETIGIAILSEVIATILGYLCKSFLENKDIAKNKLEDKKIRYNYEEMLNNEDNLKIIDTDDESVG